MTMRFGMSDKLGPRVLGHAHGAPFLGRDMHSEPDYSDEMAREIDNEIRRIIEAAFAEARTVLREHRQQLDELSEILLRRETIEREEFLGLLEGKAEDDVFRAKDERDAQARAEAERELAEEKPVKPSTTPPATAGPPVPEA
jgi:cell division protease FtsH